MLKRFPLVGEVERAVCSRREKGGRGRQGIINLPVVYLNTLLVAETKD
jgi:hypothetical protein